MRILHLTPELPRWPGGTGGATRQFHLLRRLAELGHEVRVVAPVPAGAEEAAGGLAAAGIGLAGARRPTSRPLEALRALGRRPSLALEAAVLPVLAWQVGVLWTALRPAARRIAQEWSPHVITVEHDNAASWAGDMPTGPARVLVLQNVGWHYYESRARVASGPARAALSLEAARFRRLHARRLPGYDALVAVSDRDAEDLRSVTDRPVEVVPNGVASDELRPLDPSEEPATVLFTGTLSHPPNTEGIGWFAERAWPLVRAAAPDARLLVVGRDPPPEVQALGAREGIEVVGAVPEVAPYFGRATAVVVPLLSGGGTRLKILEALACGRALVSTTVGAEGLALAPGEELLIADSPEDFADSTARLLRDGDLRLRLAAAGRRVVESRYDWRTLGDRLAGILQGVAHEAGR